MTQQAVQPYIKQIEEASIRSEALLKGLGIPREVFERIAVNALLRSAQDNRPGYRLVDCTPVSLFRACVECAQHGLLPDGQQAALVPRRNRKKDCMEASFMPMVAGLLMKAREHVKNASIQAHTVYKGDEFSETRGTKPEIHHVPHPDAGRGAENVIAVYATVFYAGNPVPEFEVLYKKDIEWFRNRSPAKDAGPWVSDYGEMAEVRALKRVLKRMPQTPSLKALLDAEDEEAIEGEATLVDETMEGTIVDETPAAAPAAIEHSQEQPMPAPSAEPAREAEPVPAQPSQAPAAAPAPAVEAPAAEAPDASPPAEPQQADLAGVRF